MHRPALEFNIATNAPRTGALLLATDSANVLAVFSVLLSGFTVSSTESLTPTCVAAFGSLWIKVEFHGIPPARH